MEKREGFKKRERNDEVSVIIKGNWLDARWIVQVGHQVAKRDDDDDDVAMKAQSRWPIQSIDRMQFVQYQIFQFFPNDWNKE